MKVQEIIGIEMHDVKQKGSVKRKLKKHQVCTNGQLICEKCQTSILIKEIQIKMILQFFLIIHIMTVIKKLIK